jgi:hypothetical protein
LIEPSCQAEAIAAEQPQRKNAAERRLRGAHRLFGSVVDQHGLGKVNGDVLFVKYFSPPMTLD